jgi:hypothetical protein
MVIRVFGRTDPSDRDPSRCLADTPAWPPEISLQRTIASRAFVQFESSKTPRSRREVSLPAGTLAVLRKVRQDQIEGRTPGRLMLATDGSGSGTWGRWSDSPGSVLDSIRPFGLKDGASRRATSRSASRLCIPATSGERRPEDRFRLAWPRISGVHSRRLQPPHQRYGRGAADAIEASLFGSERR